MSKYVTFYKSSIDVKPSNGGDEGTCYFKKYLDKKLIKQQEIKKCSASKETSANDQSRKGQNYQGTKEESEGVGLLDIHSAILAAQAALRSYEAKTGENLAQNIQVSRGQSSSSAILINDHRALSISVLGSSSESVSEVSRSSELNSLNECKVSKDSVGSFSGLSMSHQVFALPGKDNGLPRSEIKQQVTVKADSAGANTAFVALDKDKDFSAKVANGPVNSHSELPSSHHSSARFDKDNGLTRGEIKQQVTVKADSAGANTAFVALDKDKDFSAKVANGPVNSHSELPSSHHSSARFDKDNGLPRGEIKQQVTVKADSAGANTAFVALDKDKDFSAKVANGPVNSHSELPSSHHSSARFDKDNGLPCGEIKQQVTVKADSAGANTAFVALDKDKDFSAKVANGPVNSHSELPSSHHSSARFDKDNGLTRGEIKQQVTLNAGLVSHSANGHLGKEELNVKVTKGAVKFHSESSIGNSASFHLGQYGDLHKELVKEQPKSNINSAIGGEPLNYLSHQICTSNVNAFEKTENGFNYLSQSTDVSITTNREPELQAVTQASLGINHISDISNRTSTCYLLGNYIHVNTYRVYFRDKCYTFEFRYSGRNELIRFVERKYDGY